MPSTSISRHRPGPSASSGRNRPIRSALSAVRSASCSWDPRVLACVADKDFVLQRFAGDEKGRPEGPPLSSWNVRCARRSRR
jgi:hypothetical protein